ncbi:hypothetical protein JOD57_000059 [Geodermatophilus bullaregiensis]|uniref:hypothetical protein n=1 Tax=Geodermatophilus bullaregiensis TaxID=1564160 RepID=UPI00195EB44C|nr:hypothetical protein [Geodermatophilus bullaregiensis]MBM7804222.1 hypothetical protein [Geodermatophilus bullaregiensis]
MSRASRPRRSRPGLLLQPGCDPGLRVQLRADGRVVLSSRASGDGGVRPRDLAVDGIFSAADGLAAWGIDVRPLLPDKATLLTGLTTLADTRTSYDRQGRTFTNHRFVYTDAAPRGLVLLLQYGTGVQIDRHHRQPAIELAAEAIRKWSPVLVYCNEIRAWGRAGFPLASLVYALEDIGEEHGQPVYVGDLKHAPRPLTPQVARELFNDGAGSEEEARHTKKRTRDGYRRRTDSGAAPKGRFRYGLAAPLPPPLARARLRDTEIGGVGEQIAFLDTPGPRPEPEEVLYGLPQLFETRDGRKQPVDQLALVRWFYRHYLLPGWDAVASARYLAAHGFSTDGVRSHNRDPGTPVHVRHYDKHGTQAYHICQAILRHRDFHRTLTLTVRVGDGGPDLALQLSTPDGLPICSDADYGRIAAAEAQLRSLHRPGPGHTFTGQPVTIDGIPATLEARHRKDAATYAEGTTYYTYQRAGSKEERTRRRHYRGPVLLHSTLAVALLKALGASDPRLRPRLPDDDRLQRLSTDQAAAAQALDQEEDKRRRAEAHVTKPQLTGRALALAVEAVATADRRVADARRALDSASTALAAAQAPTGTGLPVSEIFAFALSLRDPRSPAFKDLLRRDLVDVTLTSHSDVREDGRTWWTLTLAGCLAVCGGDGRTYTVPFAAEHTAPAYRPSAD